MACCLTWGQQASTWTSVDLSSKTFFGIRLRTISHAKDHGFNHWNIIDTLHYGITVIPIKVIWLKYDYIYIACLPLLYLDILMLNVKHCDRYQIRYYTLLTFLSKAYTMGTTFASFRATPGPLFTKNTPSYQSALYQHLSYHRLYIAFTLSALLSYVVYVKIRVGGK